MAAESVGVPAGIIAPGDGVIVTPGPVSVGELDPEASEETGPVGNVEEAEELE